MIFAVGMTFIDMTIVSIAIPEIQSGLHLSETGMQWVVNGYLLALAASFALGGRLGDTFGKRRMVTLGVIIFAGASALCSLTPEGSLAEAWIIAFRVAQGIGAALMIPAVSGNSKRWISAETTGIRSFASRKSSIRSLLKRCRLRMPISLARKID